MRKSFWFWLCFVVAIVLAVYFATRVIMVTGGRGRLGVIRHISITTDNAHDNLSELAAATGIAPGTRSYTTRLDAVNARIAAVPGVRASAVRRLPNGNLAIRAEMYHAVALWTDDGETFFPISADGTIVKNPQRTRNPAAVLFRGPVPSDIDEITRVAGNLGTDLDYLEWIENRRWNMHTTGGITVMLPQNDPAAAISTLIILNKNNQILGRSLTTIDMRDPSRVLVK